MKTIIKSIVLLSAIGFFGVLNSNAASNCSLSAGESTYSTSVASVLNSDADAVVDYQKEAQLLTKWVADNEEAKTIKMLMDRNEFFSNEEVDSSAYPSAEVSESLADFQNEARVIARSIADQQEAKMIQKLVEEGRLAQDNL
jgi:hypothetical protein